MGLAASQARLLTITARLADNELRSQTINNAKMRLATQSSKASEDYVNALNNATMKFTNYALDGESQTQNLTFNALTAYSSYNNQYGLVNSSGQLLVSETEAALFEKANGNLNSYLQYHGLTYETTYFENVGAITNEGYIEPFNYISVEDMKTYFEEYNSYENSQEVEDYSKLYNQYVSANSALENVAETVLTQYLTSNNNQNKITASNGSFSMDYGGATTLEGMLQALKDAFGNNNNSYSKDHLSDLIGIDVLTEYRDLFNSVTINSSTGTVTSTDPECSLESLSGTEYRLDGNILITLDSTTGMVSSVAFDSSAGTTGEGDTITGTTGVGLEQCINSINATISGNTTTYHVDDISSLEVTSTTTSAMPDEAASREYVDDILSQILNEIIDDYSITFVENVCQDPAENPAVVGNQIMLGIFGVDLTSNVTGTTKTLSQYYNEYENAEHDYLTGIFDSGSIAQVQTDISNKSYTDADGNIIEISYRDLTDVDFVLRYMESQGLQPSETFLTVIKEFVVDQIIDEYGTPKYAWVDSTDPDNTGNADAKAQWYTNLFKRMQQGYKALENGLASSAEWIEYALESGIVTMEQVDSTYTWQGLDYKACSRITEETDDAAVTKAEAEYSRTMNDIEAKDNIYDLELKNIDTEHSSLQTEYESIKNVISKNIERTFNFYKNA